MDSLLAMGFDEISSREALAAAGGNVDVALEMILGGTLPEQSAGHGESSIAFNDTDTVMELGVSQYSFGESGSSACTVIACSVVKLLLTQLNGGQSMPDVSELTQAVQDGVAYYRTLPMSSRSHLAIDELGSYMTHGVSGLGDAPIQGLLSTPRCFHDMFTQARLMAYPEKYIAVVVTKPPETVCVLLPPTSAPPGSKFIFFDSHSRPQFGYSGAYMVLCNDEMGLVSRLQAVFPSLAMEGGGEDYMQMMYNMFEGSVFQSI